MGRLPARAREECGIEIERRRMVCVYVRSWKRPERPGGLRFVFHCGVLCDARVRAICLQAEEISEHRFVDLEEAAELLSGRVRRRVLGCVGADCCLYLEDGRPVASVTG